MRFVIVTLSGVTNVLLTTSRADKSSSETHLYSYLPLFPPTVCFVGRLTIVKVASAAFLSGSLVKHLSLCKGECIEALVIGNDASSTIQLHCSLNFPQKCENSQ